MVERGGHFEPKEKQDGGEQPGSVEFHKRAKADGAYNRLPEHRRALLEAYLTTSATYEELQPLAGNVSIKTVRKHIHRGMRELTHGLSDETIKELAKMNRRRPRRQEG